MHFAIQKLHWTPSDIKDWTELDDYEKAFCFASTDIRMEAERKEFEKMKKKKR